MTTATALGELTGDYVLDAARSRIGFTARAALVSKVRGRFDAFEGSARLDGGSPSRSTVRLTIRAAGVQTRNTKRDDHLRSGDFLDAESHPDLTFASTTSHSAGLSRRMGETDIRAPFPFRSDHDHRDRTRRTDR